MVEQVVKDYGLVLLTSDDDQMRRASAGGYAAGVGDLEDGFEHAASHAASTLLQVKHRTRVGCFWLL